MKKNLSPVQSAAQSLILAPASFEQAKYAVLHWHYSKAMPAGKLVKYGVWEDKKYIGVVLFGRGANHSSAHYYGLKITECCELVRVALKEHITPTTKIVAIALRLLHKDNPGIRLVFSYADKTNQGHKGIIYHAGNWEYLGERTAGKGAHWLIDGKLVHNRTINARFGGLAKIPPSFRAKMLDPPTQTKHLFIYKFDKSVETPKK